MGIPEAYWVNFGTARSFETVIESRDRCSALLRFAVNESSIFPIMAEHLSREERLKLIHQNLQEVLKPDIIEQIVLKEDRPLKIYWGMAKLDL